MLISSILSEREGCLAGNPLLEYLGKGNKRACEHSKGMAMVEQRVSRLEGEYGHLATKAEIAEVRGEVKSEIADIRGELRGIKWTLVIAITIATLVLAGLQAALKYIA